MERKTQNNDIKPPVFPHTQWLRGKKKKREEKKKLPMGAGTVNYKKNKKTTTKKVYI